MAYTKINWKNEVPNGVPRYEIVDHDSTPVAQAATIELVNVVTPGTPVNAQNLGHMDEGIAQAHEEAAGAKAAAQTAQGTANLARTEAAGAQAAANNAAAAANAANTKALQAAGIAAAAQSDADAAQTSADNALVAANARVPLFNSAVRTSEFSTSSTSWVDVLSVTLNMPAAGTILALAHGAHRAENNATGSEVRLLIDGQSSGAFATKSCNGTQDISWTGFGLAERRVVSAGNRVIKIQQRQGGAASGPVYVQTANIVAIGFRS